MQLTPYTPQHGDVIVNFIAAHNSDPQHHIGYFGTHPADIRNTIAEFVREDGTNFMLAWHEHELVGVLGVDSDGDLGRAWLYGPLIVADDWHRIADVLYAQLKPTIPSQAHEHELFFDRESRNCEAFAQRHGFQEHGDHAILNFQREQLSRVPDIQLAVCPPEYAGQLTQLHDELFPNTYMTAQEMLDQQDEQHTVLVVCADDQLLGYVCGRAEPEAGEGFIEYIGVAPHTQRRGIGKQLLQAILHWMFNLPTIQRTDLVVSTTNEAAIGLYRATGFTTERIMRAYRTAG